MSQRTVHVAFAIQCSNGLHLSDASWNSKTGKLMTEEVRKLVHELYEKEFEIKCGRPVILNMQFIDNPND